MGALRWEAQAGRALDQKLIAQLPALGQVAWLPRLSPSAPASMVSGSPSALEQWGNVIGRSDSDDDSRLPSGHLVPGVLSTDFPSCVLTTALGGGTIMPILQMKKRRPGQVQGHAQGLPASQWPSWGSGLDLCLAKAMPFPPCARLPCPL